MKKIFLFLMLFTFPVQAQQMCGDYEVPEGATVSSKVEVVFCADLFYCTDLTYGLNDTILKEKQRNDALKERLKRYQLIIRKLRKVKK